jgi:hypothetical protein
MTWRSNLSTSARIVSRVCRTALSAAPLSFFFAESERGLRYPSRLVRIPAPAIRAPFVLAFLRSALSRDWGRRGRGWSLNPVAGNRQRRGRRGLRDPSRLDRIAPPAIRAPFVLAFLPDALSRDLGRPGWGLFP